ncbi:hypothetical protein SteCoe_13787 [Stentor coeruleus]|uniref:RING-type domain-containing protein n=1 Tax=Stentor coeruleus TaxID=5963 RepID=A0A1R2C7N8_9CILI|nr:hypothetical protein SteCoe_13787 [Stentor coeruleus]
MMSISQVKCLALCLLCDKKADFFLNNSKYHGLCETHSKSPNDIYQCSYCASQIKKTIISPIYCEQCYSETRIYSMKCGHRLCNFCSKDYTNCLICFPNCSCCNESTEFFIEDCGHFICEKCILPGKKCSKCNPKICLNCNTAKIHQNSNYCKYCEGICTNCDLKRTDLKVMDCEHPLCKNCINNGFTCMICNKTHCNACKKLSKRTKNMFICGHRICRNCDNEYWKGKCPICDGTFHYKCQKCGKLGPLYDCKNSLHKFCIDCDSTFCPFCQYKCCICQMSFKNDEVEYITCGHISCKKCAMVKCDERPECALCPKSHNIVNCYNCRKEYEVLQDGMTSRNCEGCKKKICLGCGGEISLFTFKEHACQL